ncbi:MAG: GH92 family glycosyl hydrolase [Kiritimatiellaeota bacterium]|nr:GH92 family glycosyl hydrolase [Kiritimatiellota bacterium]
MKSPVDYVDPHIGAIAPLLAVTSPTVQLPHGMVRIAPLRARDQSNPWLADRILGFPLNIISHRGAGAFRIMADSSGGVPASDFTAEVDHAFETATPYAFSTLLEDSQIEASYTVTEHAAIFRFKCGTGLLTCPNINIRFGVNETGNLTAENDTTFGSETISGIKCHFYAKTSEQAQTTEVRVGFSFISVEQARANMETEVAGRTFEQVAEAGRAAWENSLNAIAVEGGTERERRIFYTSFWRCHERQINITEVGVEKLQPHNRYFSAYDNRVHENEKPFYVDDWLWDTHRGLHPLRLITDPARECEILDSYARMVAQSPDHWAPVFPHVYGNKPAMLGNHCAAAAADAYMKGARDFDIETLYAGLRRNATIGSRLPWHIGNATELDRTYDESGFFPSLAPGQEEWVPEAHKYERRQSVSVTLEHAYDDWCIAQLARALGKEDDAQLFAKRALNYRNLYSEKHGVFAPRTADGAWVEPFDPELSGGQGGRDYYAECNGLTWAWSVPHNVADLINLMGGRDEFFRRLDHYFNQPLTTSKWDFLKIFPDSTGLIGHFCMGNEPGFLIPYLYLYCGAPWRTQRRVRQIMDYWFDDTPHGVCGDDDGGAMAAWYVFSAMGIYPLCPGRPVYGIGSPIFAKTRLRLPDGVFEIIAENVSTQNKYVQSAELNGAVLEKCWFTHDALVAGGSLVLRMGPRPNKEWGAGPEDAPPSM